LKSDDAVAAVLDDAKDETTTKGGSTTTTNNVTIGTRLVSLTTPSLEVGNHTFDEFHELKPPSFEGNRIPL